LRISARTRLGVAGLAIAIAALPAIGPATGQEKPESILPPGFGTTAPAPAPTPAPTGPTRVTPQGSDGSPVATVQPLPSSTPTPSDSASPTPTASATIDPAILAQYEMPSFARRSLAEVGPTGTSEGGLAPDAFGATDGPFLETLMRRVAAPLPSRWLSILLRRTLVSRVTTPRGVGGADFAAERGWLLLRMGEAAAARAVVQAVDNSDYTPKLYQVAMNSALANGDPGELCPIADAALAATRERGWTVAQAMCAGLSGNPNEAKSQIAAVRRRGVATGLDLQLAQKVVGAGPDGGQAVTIEWDGVDRLSAWRFGLATATNVAIPAALFETAGRQALYWYGIAPGIALTDRLPAAEAAAAQGVISAAALVDLYGALAGSDDAGAAGAIATDLRTAYVGADRGARLAALRSVWGDPAGAPAYARLVLTSRAAARVPVANDTDEAPLLIASMLTAGLDRSAARWNGAVEAGSDGWAMITLSDPDAQGGVSYGSLSSYAGKGETALKQRLLFAGLAGLGRMSAEDVERAATAFEVPIGAQNSWTRALDRAVAAREPGTVVLLAAIGMQTGSWRGVPPAMLYRILAALRSVGLDGDARMIAAEAIARA
jgi:hypothetical protein